MPKRGVPYSQWTPEEKKRSRAAARAWNLRNPEKVRAQDRKRDKVKRNAWRRENYRIRAEEVASYNKNRRDSDPVGMLLGLAKSRAKKAGREFRLTREDIVIPVYCPVLGIRLTHGTGPDQQSSWASIDRIDNEKGYVPGNVIIVSHRANSLKRDATVDELQKLATFYGGLRSCQRSPEPM